MAESTLGDSTDAGDRTEAVTAEATPDLAGALHDVSNSLTVMLGWLERARIASDGLPEAVRAVAIAASRARLARTIVRRAIGAKVPPEPPHTAGELVAEIVLAFDPELRAAGLTIDTAIEPAVAEVPLEGGSTITQVLTNLLLNAIAFSPNGSAVVLEAKQDDEDAVLFAVSDEGPGVPVERRRDLLHAGISTRDGGAGIGLRYAAALAREAGGRLMLSDGVGSGARFELRWPRVLKSADDVAPASTRVWAMRGFRVLVIEDDAAVTDLLETALTARGASVLAAKNRAELSGILAAGPFDAALLDISPIQDDIVGTLAALRKASPGVRLVVMSGSAVALPALPAEWGAVWVRKPFEIGEILRAVAPRSA